MKTKIVISVALFYLLAISQIQAQKKIKVNAPLPDEYVNKIGKIFLEDEVTFLNPKVIIFASIYGPAIIMHGAARKQQRIKEEKIAKEKVFQNDSGLVVNAIKKEIFSVLKQKGIQTREKSNQTEYSLKVRVYDHGFHWATKSGAGIFLRVQLEVVDLSGKAVWSMVYTMTKSEAKKTHYRGAMTLNKCIDKCIADFEKKPGLLKEQYELISSMIAKKLFALAK